MSLCEKVRTLMKDIDETKIKKLASLTVPSFKIGLKNQSFRSEVTSLKISKDGDTHVSGGS